MEVQYPLLIVALLVGAIMGGIIALLATRRHLAVVQREHQVELQRREGAIDRLKHTVKENAARLRRQEDDLRELASVRRERMSLLGDLEQSRRTIAELQHSLDALRTATRETELRLTATLESERQEAASRRTVNAAELAAAQEGALNLRAELASVRETATRATARLEADLASARAMLERTMQDLHSERTASEEARTALTRRLRELEDTRGRVEADLAKERRESAEKQQALRTFVSTLREQYALACAERDAASREAELRRTQADDVSRALEAARDEFARRLDEEHAEAVLVLSKVWDYVHNYGRLRERPVTPPVVPLADAPPVAEPADEIGPAPSAAPPPPTPSPPPTPPARDTTVEREVVTAPRGLADAPARPSGETTTYDIEEALGDTTPNPQRQPGLPTGTTRVRRPISAMRRENDVLVICDDGSVWSKRPTGWVQEPAIPGTDDAAARAPAPPSESPSDGPG